MTSTFIFIDKKNAFTKSYKKKKIPKPTKNLKPENLPVYVPSLHADLELKIFKHHSPT